MTGERLKANKILHMEENSGTLQEIENEVDTSGAPVDRGWAWVILAGKNNRSGNK